MLVAKDISAGKDSVGLLFLNLLALLNGQNLTTLIVQPRLPLLLFGFSIQ